MNGPSKCRSARKIKLLLGMLAKLNFCSEFSQNFTGCSFARARIFLQVLACWVFGGVAF